MMCYYYSEKLLDLSDDEFYKAVSELKSVQFNGLLKGFASVAVPLLRKYKIDKQFITKAIEYQWKQKKIG